MTFRRARGALYMSLKVRILRTMSTWPGIFQGEPAFAVGGAHEVAPCAPPFLFAGPLPDYQSKSAKDSSHIRQSSESTRTRSTKRLLSPAFNHGNAQRRQRLAILGEMRRRRRSHSRMSSFVQRSQYE